MLLDFHPSRKPAGHAEFPRAQHPQELEGNDQPGHGSLPNGLARCNCRSRGVSVLAVGLRDRFYRGGAQAGHLGPWDGLHDILPVVARRAGMWAFVIGKNGGAHPVGYTAIYNYVF